MASESYLGPIPFLGLAPYPSHASEFAIYLTEKHGCSQCVQIYQPTSLFQQESGHPTPGHESVKWGRWVIRTPVISAY